MKLVNQLIQLIVLIPVLVFCQGVDSVRIKEIDSLLKLSNELAKDQKFEKALEINAMAEEIALKTLDQQQYIYGKISYNRAIIYDSKAEFTKAIKWYIQSISLFENTKDIPIIDIIRSLNALGNIYRILGQFEISESCLLESFYLQEINNKSNTTDFSFCLNNLGILYFTLGQYENAELYYNRALTVKAKIFGNRHPEYAVSLICLANLYSTLENFQKAELLYLKAKEIYEIQQNTNSSEYGMLINNLGNLNLSQNKFKLSEKYYFQAISVYQKLFGIEHPEYAMSINNLGALYFNMGKVSQADSCFLIANSIWLKTLGEEHPDYLASQNNLAAIYFESGNYNRAKDILIQTNSIYKKILGNMHPDYIYNLYQLVRIHWVIKEYEIVKVYLTEAIATERKLLHQASIFLSEVELSKYIQNIAENQDLVLSINNESLKLNEMCFDNSLFYKGYILNARMQLNKYIKMDTKNFEKLQCWKNNHEELVKMYSTKMANKDRNQLDSLLELTNTLEKELNLSLKGFKNVNLQVIWKDIQSNLGKDEAAIEFIHFNINFPNASDSIMYAALLLRPNENRPIFIPLFEERVIDSLLQSKSERRADYVNSLYTLADRGAVVIGTSKKSLYEILWKPIEKELSGIKTIYFSPSGLLHRINLDAIPISQTETLADKYQLIELSSTRQLVIPPPNQNVNDIAVLYGGVHFDLDSATQESESGFASRTNEELSFNKVDSTLRSGTWSYLHGSEKEVNSIQKILMNSGIKTNLKSANEATEESFKSLGANNNSSPRVLHIATHGYFFPDRTSSATGRMAHDSAASEGTAKAASIKPQFIGSEEPVFKISDHPMLRSGLIMAGGNAAWQGKPTIAGREDGILTAYEISQMNLSNTELVVLSACETGLGDIQGNEGVYGLQRAFKIAGAKYLIMSLWQVPDKQTSMLMISFYKKWLENKMTIPDAFHAAQKELRDLGFDPYQWAGFVLVE